VSNVSIYNTDTCTCSGLAGKDLFTYPYASHATRDTVDYLSHLGLADKMEDFWDASTLLAGWVQLETSQNMPEHLQSQNISIIQH